MGADAIKLQTYNADTMTIDCNLPCFQINEGLWKGYNLYKLYDWAHTPYKWHQALFDHAKKIGITIFSTPFDETAVDLLESLNTPAYKIASFEVTDLPLIARVAQTQKPLIISTGMANASEIKEAVTTAKEHGAKDIVFLHCISAYPAPAEQSNLRTIPDLAKKFDTLVGLSDHTMGITVAVSSVALGACLIEKHITLSRQDKGPDSEFSLEPQELEQLCQQSTIAWKALGAPSYERKAAEKENVKFRRSLFFVADIHKGKIIEEQDVRRIRPGFGLEPKYLKDVIGKKATVDITRGTPVNWELITD